MIFNLIGHQDVFSILSMFLNSKRLPQSILFVGLDGIGKSLVAKILINILVKDDYFKSIPVSLKHYNIRELLQIKRYVDVLWVEKRVNLKTGILLQKISIEQIKEVKLFLQRKSYSNGYRIIVINTLDDLSKNASNALLKMLEEPPKKLIFILIAHKISKVLPTIRSRSQFIPFKPLSLGDFREFMNRELSDLSTNERKYLEVLSVGSPGRAKMFYKNNGIYIFQCFLNVISKLNSPLFTIELNVLISSILQKFRRNVIADKTSCEILLLIMEIWLSRAIKLISLKLKTDLDLLDKEIEALNALMQSGSLFFWSDAWLRLIKTSNEVGTLSLDPVSVIFDIFSQWKGIVSL